MLDDYYASKSKRYVKVMKNVNVRNLRVGVKRKLAWGGQENV